MAKNVYGKKKTARNILIAVIAVLVIAVAIFLTVALQKDSAGLNCFQRNATAVSADGMKASISEYKVLFDAVSSNYGSTTLSDEQIKNLQEYCAREVVKQKIYAKEAKALGLSLTEEQIAACNQSADDHIASIEKSYADSMVESGSYSKTAFEKQMDSFFQRLGMSRTAYRAFLKENAAGEYYRQAIAAYYEENKESVDENVLVDFYRKSVEKTMTTTDEDGHETPTYSDGTFWNYMMMYQIGYSASPMLYVPEGFIYIDFIKLEKDSAEELEEIIEKVKSGEMSFDELMESDDNKDSFKGFIPSPYPIAENDHSSLFSEDDVFQKASALNVGEINSYIAEPVEKDDGTSTVTAYLFRRAEGTMCYDGDHGVIKMDWFPGVREAELEEYRLDQWMSDLKFEDAIYAYKGAIG